MATRTELGCAGHLIVAASCRWRRHTQVGNYRVSTVGDNWAGNNRYTVGSGSRDWYETMVFRTSDEQVGHNEECGCREVTDWIGIESDRWATAGEAQAGHESFVEKYAAIADGE